VGLLWVSTGLTNTSGGKWRSSQDRGTGSVNTTAGRARSALSSRTRLSVAGSIAPSSSRTPGGLKPLAGATINVTTTQQKVAGQGTGGCSLQEAIFSANLHTNMAIDSINPDGTDHFVTTDCAAGTGNDTIVLPGGAVFQMGNIIDDAHNYMGPTATPIIFSNITIEANGSRLEPLTGSPQFRAFAVGTASINLNPGGTANVVSGTGSLTIRNGHIRGFVVKGGDGGDAGGGGGLGAGGAIYVNGGGLTVESCTFEANGAIGGNGGGGGGTGGGGGGGGLAGNGGTDSGGGGGARGNGGGGQGGGAGGGGGTLGNGADGTSTNGGAGGLKCGGNGANPFNNSGGDALCVGGGGGGGSTKIIDLQHAFDTGGQGGKGSYGGGGGGGGFDTGTGAHGGFGGGGGGSGAFAPGAGGGDGGFGGGGGSGFGQFPVGGGAGKGGFAGGNATGDGNNFFGGGGGALGGAIFNDSGTVVVRNSTFFNNFVDRGIKGGPGADNGADAGGGIFSRNGSLTVLGSTISGNRSTGSGGGLAAINDGATASLTIRNTIIANNGGDECFFVGTVTHSGSGNLIVQNFGCPGMVSMADPQLGPLQINDPGSTPTMAITTASPAFDAGDDNNCPPTDQRGVTRPQFAHCDIGAYEVRPCPLTCPANITVSNDANQCGAVVNYPAPNTGGGDCGAVTCSPGSGSFFPIGTTTVTCTSAAGSCSFTVTVNDTQAPTITCPASITMNTGGPNVNSVVVDYPPPVATDNCPGVTVVCNPKSGSSFNVGTTTVTCTATDAAGNQTSCSFQVLVTNTLLAAPTGDSLQWNSNTGDYLFKHCGPGAFTLVGKGTVALVNNIRTLTDIKSDRRISANFNLGQLTGRATLTLLVAPGVYQTFIISQTTPNASPGC
jgi:hypothetical protein